MNSLQELNNYSNSGLNYTDTRPYTIAFDVATGVAQTDTVNEGDVLEAKVGANITTLFSVAGSVDYEVNVAAVTGATVSWDDPDGLSVTNPSTGVYKILGISSVAQWNNVRYPEIELPRDYSGNFQYTSAISDSFSNIRTWTTSVSVQDLPEISVPTNHTYDEDITAAITGYPQVLDSENDGTGTYTLIITPSDVAAVDTITTAGTGGTAAFNNSTKALTITGNRTQVNSHLASMTLNPGNDYTDNFTLTYQLTNPVSALVSTRVQDILIGITNEEIDNMSLTRFYKIDRDGLLFSENTPTITEAGTYTISLQLASNIGFISTSSTGTGWTAGTLTWSFTGTNTQCNTQFQNLKFWPNKSASATVETTYTQVEGGVTQVIQAFDLVAIPADAVISVGVSETVLEDAQNVTFTNIGRTAPYWNYDITVVLTPTQDSCVLSGTGATWQTLSIPNQSTGDTHLIRTFSAPLDIDAITSYLNSVEADLTIGRKAAFDIRLHVYLTGSYAIENRLGTVVTGYNITAKTNTTMAVSLGNDWRAYGHYLQQSSGLKNDLIARSATNGTQVVSGTLTTGIWTRTLANWVGTSNAWTNRVATGALYDIRYIPAYGKFLAVGENFGVTGTPNMIWSSDGITWSACTNARVGYDDINAGLFTAIGVTLTSSVLYVTSAQGHVLKSDGGPDGNWTLLYGPAEDTPTQGQLGITATDNNGSTARYFGRLSIAGDDDDVLVVSSSQNQYTARSTNGTVFNLSAATVVWGFTDLDYNGAVWAGPTVNQFETNFNSAFKTTNGVTWTQCMSKNQYANMDPYRMFYDHDTHCWMMDFPAASGTRFPWYWQVDLQDLQTGTPSTTYPIGTTSTYNPFSVFVINNWTKLPEVYDISGFLIYYNFGLTGSPQTIAYPSDGMLMHDGILYMGTSGSGRAFQSRKVIYTFTIPAFGAFAGDTVVVEFPWGTDRRSYAVEYLYRTFQTYITDNSLPWTLTKVSSTGITVNFNNDSHDSIVPTLAVTETTVANAGGTILTKNSATVQMDVSGNSFTVTTAIT